MPLPPGAHSDSASSYSSSKSSLLAPPLDDISSQSDVADAFPHAMPRNDAAVYAVAASPTHPTIANVSATQKLKRAFGKRRRPSQDAGSFLSSGDERSPSGSSSQRPSAAKITMHLFGARKHHQPPDPNQPPPLPPKDPGLRAPHPSNPQHQANSNASHSTTLVSRPRTSVIVSPSITAAIEFMREDEERERAAERLRERERTALESHREMEENKENWRKSDSTMDSGHTVRPATAPDPASKRVSAFLAASPGSGNMDLLEFLAGAPEPEGQWQDSRPSDVSPGRQSKRRSRSLNITIPSSLSSPSSLSAASVPSLAHSPSYPTPPASTDLAADDITSSGHTVPITSSPGETPVITRTPANGIITSGSPVSKSNIRGRLAAWTGTTGTVQGSPSPSPLSTTPASTSTPSLTTSSMTSMHQAPHRRVIVTSDASPPFSSDIQAMAAVRQMQNRVRSPSASSTSSSAGIRQAATSLTSGAGAMALGLGKRAYEKVGRVWGSSQSGSGSGSDTPSHRQPSPVNAYSSQPHPFHNPSHGPSAFLPQNRRTPGTSGTWSVSSMGGSRSSSEKDRSASNPESSGSSMSSGLGRLVRPPRSNTGGVVFGRQLWICVKDTKATVLGPARDPLGARMIPALVYRCAQHIHKWGLEEEGLFRISGRSSHISRLRNEFDGGADYDITECSPSELDPHAVASVFKAYLRELPEPILTRALGPSFDAAVSAEGSHGAPSSASGLISKSIVGGGSSHPSAPRAIPSLRKPPSLSTFTLPTSSSLRAPSSTLIEALGDLISRLPPENRDVLQTVVELMNATAARSAETKMPLSNLLLVFCPSLSMPPTLLRTLCDVQAIWEPRPPVVVDILRKPGEGESEVGGGDSDGSVEDSDSGLEDGGDIVLLPSGNVKGKQREVVEASASAAEVRSGSVAETACVKAEEVVGPVGFARSRVIQRVPVPTLFLDSQQLDDSRPYMAKSLNFPVLTDPPLRLESIPSRDISGQGRTTPSPMRSEGSLNSVLADKRDLPPPPTQLYPPSNSVSSVLITYAPPNHDKDLPASPRTPVTPIGEPCKTQEEVRPDTTQAADAHRSVESSDQTADAHLSEESLEQTADAHRSEESVNTLDSSATSQPRRPEVKHAEASLSPLGKEVQSESAPELRTITDTPSERSVSLPTPLVLRSPSTPSVAFPSIPKTTPSTPTSLKKHTLTMSLGRTLKMSADDTSDPPSPSRRLARRPSLNMLLNLTRSGSPSPRVRTPTISSPLTSPVMAEREGGGKEMNPSVVPNMFPPVLTLPIEGGIDMGLGWDDMFGKEEEATSVPALQRRDTVTPRRPATHPSSLSYGAPAESPAASSGCLLRFSGPPSGLPSATAVLQTASSSPIKPSSASPPSSPSSSSAASSPFVFREEDTSSGEDRSMVEFPRVPTPVEEEEPLSPAPHLNFQLRGASLEEEDWASIVLLAAGKPAESIA